MSKCEPGKPFNFTERAGLLFTIEGAVLSLVAVTLILCFALFKWLRRTVITWGKERPSDASDSSLFLNLMLADLVQAIGIMPNFRWMGDAAVTAGSLCTTQAGLKQVGIVGTSITSLAIALHTFAVLVLRWRPPQHVSKFAVAFIWLFTAIVVGIPNAVHQKKTPKYYGPTGYWCWIVKEYKAEQIVTEYLWVWFSALSMLVLYTIMFCVMMGWINIGTDKDAPIILEDSDSPLEKGTKHIKTQEESEEDKRTKDIARMMLYFPAVYIITVLPNSISRWLSFSGRCPDPRFILFANTIFALSGLFNFILFFSTRPAMVVGEKIVVVTEAHIPNAPSMAKRSFSDSSSIGHLPDRKPERKASDIQSVARNTTTSGRVLDDETSQSPLTPTSPGSGYLSVDRQQHRRSRTTKSTSEDESEDYGMLPTRKS